MAVPGTTPHALHCRVDTIAWQVPL